MIDKSKKNKNYVLMDNLVSRSILIFNKIKSFFVNVSARNKTLYVLSLAKTKESITYIKTKTEDMKLYLKKGPRFFTERTPGLYGKISGVSKKIDFIPVKKYVVQTYKRALLTSKKTPVFFKSSSDKLKAFYNPLLYRLKNIGRPYKKDLKKPGVKAARIPTPVKSLNLKKMLVYSLTGLFSIILIIAMVFGIMIYRQYQEQLAKTLKILETEKDYEIKNFNDRRFNYIELNGEKETRPGEFIDASIHFKNTGVLTVKDFKIIFQIPENVELIESMIKDYDHSIDGRLVILALGDIPQDQGGDVDIGFRVNKPSRNGTKVYLPDIQFIYVKEALSIGRKAIFNQDIDSEEIVTVFASPDFSSSGITIDEQVSSDKDENTITHGDSIIYVIEVENTGDMDAEGVRITVNKLENLKISQDDNPDFKITDGLAQLKVDSFETGDKRSFKLVTFVDDSAENNAIISPVLDIDYGDRVDEFDVVEKTVRLYPDFSGSSVLIATRLTGGVYAGDIVDVTVTIKNTGNIEARNVNAGLVFSNIFMPDQGEIQWVIDNLEVGGVAEYKASFKIVGDITSDTFGKCSLKIKSDGMTEINTGSSSILVSGEKPFMSNIIPIISLHGIEVNPVGDYELSSGQFEALCSTLQSYGYKTITFIDLIAYIDGKKQLPEKPVIITSDDGYQSIYTQAFPILKKYGYKMTVFLSTGYIGNSDADRMSNDFDKSLKGITSRPMLIWPEVYAMSGYGIEFQSHSVTHRNIGNISDSDAYFELAQSKADIESHLGKPCIIIAWPHNSYSGYSRSILSEIGYRGAAEYGSGKSENTTTIKLYAIKRIPIYRQNPPSSYVSLLGLN